MKSRLKVMGPIFPYLRGAVSVAKKGEGTVD